MSRLVDRVKEEICLKMAEGKETMARQVLRQELSSQVSPPIIRKVSSVKTMNGCLSACEVNAEKGDVNK